MNDGEHKIIIIDFLKGSNGISCNMSGWDGILVRTERCSYKASNNTLTIFLETYDNFLAQAVDIRCHYEGSGREVPAIGIYWDEALEVSRTGTGFSENELMYLRSRVIKLIQESSAFRQGYRIEPNACVDVSNKEELDIFLDGLVEITKVLGYRIFNSASR